MYVIVSSTESGKTVVYGPYLVRKDTQRIVRQLRKCGMPREVVKLIDPQS